MYTLRVRSSKGRLTEYTTKAAIVKAVGDSLDPLSMEQIAERIGRKPAGWLAMQCRRLTGGGQLIEVSPGRYGLPPALRAAEA
jgi:hypothetical protein